jgi:two-component system NtrC family response regulator
MLAMARVLVLDDDENARELLCSSVQDAGREALAADCLAQARRKLQDGLDVVFLDAALPDGAGLDLLPAIRHLDHPPEVIMVTDQGDPDGAERAIRSGVWDYIEKPAPMERMLLSLNRALQYRAEKSRQREPLILKRDEIVGSSRALEEQLQLLARACALQTDVLLMGETGTGKELFARAIHENSPRADKPFVVVDCATLPRSLAESTLFGFEKGSFTGAHDSRKGLIEQAHGGTLVLDEVDALPLDLQAGFLRVLQERCFRPVGAQRERKSNFRLVAATNQNLRAMVEEGSFRSDLFYRLIAMKIRLPALRERKEDIKELVHYYIARTGGRLQGGIKAVSQEFIRELWEHDWPGNVRELFQTLESSLVAAADEPTLHPQHLPTEMRVAAARRAFAKKGRSTAASSGAMLPSWREFKTQAHEEAEYDYFHRLLKLTEFDVNEASRISGLKPARIYQIVKKHGLRRYS